MMKTYLIDVPVKINIWTRPNLQRRQFEVVKQARPSIIFIQSDGGRNEKEWELIRKNRQMYDTEIDWDCEVHRLYEDKNLGMYTMSKKVKDYIWEHVDRCIFTEDDQIPSVSFFRYCAELLEKYKDDQRIGAICGNNVLTEYKDAEPYDYFFSEIGWSIWGIATWRRAWNDNVFPLEYADNKYIKKCMLDNMTPFWYKKVFHYTKGELYENHEPGDEFFYMTNCVLQHRLSIIPTKNMISNCGTEGEHAAKGDKCWFKGPDVYNLPTFEIGKISHPLYVIDDKKFGKLYSAKLQHDRYGMKGAIYKFCRFFDLFLHGELINRIKSDKNRKVEK